MKYQNLSNKLNMQTLRLNLYRNLDPVNKAPLREENNKQISHT